MAMHAPANLTAVPTAYTIALTWEWLTGDLPTQYTISINGGAQVPLDDDPEYLATGLTPGTSYTYEVRALGVSGTSPPSTVTVDTLELVLPVEWDKPDEKYFHTGLDRAVLYPKNGGPVPWNGLSGLDEAGGGTKTILYRDGRIFYADVEPGDFEGSLTAFMYPDQFAVCAGISEATPGLFVDNQKPQRFGLAYRTLVGSGLTGDMFGYQIHLVYQATASIGARSRKTMTNTPSLMEFNFDIVAVPVKLPGMRPSAHYILDTRFLEPSLVTQLEGILYGDGEVAGRLPDPNELFEMMHFGSAITFIDHGDGTWTARGSSTNLVDHGDGTWTIHNVNGTDHGDETFTLEDTP